VCSVILVAMTPLLNGRRPWGPASVSLVLACCSLLLERGSEAQGQPMMDPGSVPPGLRDWLGRDFCGTAPWVAQFHADLAESIGRAQGNDMPGALAGLGNVLVRATANPHAAFECATAVGAGLFVAAQCADQLRLPVLSARLRQLSSIFTAYDYQMKGEEYIDQSPWPVRWMEAMDGILRSMTNLKFQERSGEAWRGLPARAAVADSSSGGAPPSVTGLKVAIVSVCDYDAGQTPLARLSQINKEEYARRHGYDVVVYEKAPVFQDPLSGLFTEPASYRPAAWSKVDAILTTLAQNRHDWVMWMDCDSFFMDVEVGLDTLISKAMAESGCSAAGTGVDDLIELRRLVNRWMEGPKEYLGGSTALMQWYDDLFDEHWARLGYACGENDVAPVTGNQTLGWSDWLLREKRPHLIASEDGLMLNTGIVLIRASSWSWQFFQKVRSMTFGKSPVTQHPWWEQTAMVYLLQLPFTLMDAARQDSGLEDIGPLAQSRGYAPACFMFSQKQVNGYPPLIAAALKTHEVFEPGDFIVSFSGCKVYSSQEVCNQLFLSYFFQVHDVQLLESDVALRLWM